MKKNKLTMIFMIFVISIIMTGCGIVKVIKIGEEGKYTGEKEIDAVEDIASIWQDSIIPDLEERAVDLSVILEESKGDLNSLADKYGKYSMGDSGELSYVVKGKGKVESLDIESKAGFAAIKIDDYSGEKNIKIQIGPVYKGASIRDSLSFIKFGDYTNQKDWAAVSQGINEYIDKNIIKKIDIKNLKDKEISFLGAFTVTLGSDDILITPVDIKID